jgi:Protein of unknown function (DUF1579)
MHLKSCVMIGLCLVTGIALAEDKKPNGKIDMKAMMEIYAKAGTPGESHKHLASLSGDWKTVTKSWADPSQPPTESKGSCAHDMILGGRFLQAICKGDMMGNKFTGMGFTGYDNHTGKYQATWIDSLGTTIYCFEGAGGPDTKIITMEGMTDDPALGPMKLRTVTRILNEKTHMFEMYATGKSGKEGKMLEITYSKK